jgi:hypothetical protein
MAYIAIVSSTAFGGGNKACFQAGLASCLNGEAEPIICKPFQSLGNYTDTDLRELVRSAVKSSPRPDLIVTAGSLEMAQAAASELREDDPKFIFLGGDELEGEPVALAGGVNMNGPSTDEVRKTLLKNIHSSVEDASMYLVVNNNSPWWRKDAKNWPESRVAKFFDGIDNPPSNNRTKDADNHFIAQFDKLAQRKPTPTGLVISADPYFSYWRKAFTIAVAEKLSIPVCYPFQDFVDASADTRNKANSVALNKPYLNNSSDDSNETAVYLKLGATAYFQLGKQVGRFIGGIADVGVVTWDGSEWRLPELSEKPLKKPVSGEASGIEIEIEGLKIRVKGRFDETVLQEGLAALRRVG